MEPAETQSLPRDPPISIFLSYSRDDRARALLVIKALEAEGFGVWWDGLLEGGTAFAKTTETALETCDAVIVLWSQRSASSHWVRDEATRGRDRGRMVPVSLDGTQPPLGFGQIHSIDFTHWRGKVAAPEFAALAKAIRTVAGSPGAQLPPTGPARSVPRASRRALLVGGGVAVVALGGGVFAWIGGKKPRAQGSTTIAVLPFANLSGDPKQTYFSDGLASEIRTVLARNPMLQILGSVSSNAIRTGKGDAKSIATSLGVGFLLDGNVQKAGETVKITVNLTNGQTGLSKWANSFERPLADIFAVQAEIAAAVASALATTIEADFSNRKDDPIGGTKNVAAFDAYLRGKDLFELHINEGSERAALAKFDEAIGIDANYAAARAARARVLVVIANQYETSEQRVRLIDDAVVEATRATTIAPRFASGFSALGYALFYGRLDPKGAKLPFERAYSLATSDVDVLSRYAIYCARTGRFAEAALAIDQATALDPLNASIFRTRGNIKYAARQYHAAIADGEHALAINPERNSVNGDIGDSYVMLGKLDKARIAYGREKNSLITHTGLAIVDHREGNHSSAQAHLDKLVAEHGDNALYQKAQVLAQWGDADAAFATLADAVRLHDAGMAYLLNDPFLDPLRSDARFKTLLVRTGFI
jgi:TolB-like protein/Tfp pilus assembly protein PilF